MYKSFLLLFLVILLTESFICTRHPSPDPCSNRTIDTSYLNDNVVNISRTYKINDTIWFISKISDTFYNKAMNDSIISEQNYLYQNFQPFRIEQIGAGKLLYYANIDFNPIVQDGAFVNNSGGYTYAYRRNSPYNYLKVGFIAGKAGLYVINVNSTYGSGGYYNDYIFIQSPSNYCKTFYGLFNIPTSQRNTQYWDSLQTSTLGIANGSANYLNKNSNNYVFFRVIP